MARRRGRATAEGRPRPPSRVSRARILAHLRAAARKGDRTALTLAVEEMRVLALSPRYWRHYLALLRSPLARLVDLLVIKQGERIAAQKGWRPERREAPARTRAGAATTARARAGAAAGERPRPGPAPAGRPRRPRRAPAAPEQPSLFEL